MYIHMYEHMYVYNSCTCVHIHISMYGCMHACMYNSSRNLQLIGLEENEDIHGTPSRRRVACRNGSICVCFYVCVCDRYCPFVPFHSIRFYVLLIAKVRASRLIGATLLIPLTQVHTNTNTMYVSMYSCTYISSYIHTYTYTMSQCTYICKYCFY